MATHSSVLAWRIPGTGEPGGLPSLGSHRVGHDWSDLAAAAALVLENWSYATLTLISGHICIQCEETIIIICLAPKCIATWEYAFEDDRRKAPSKALIAMGLSLLLLDMFVRDVKVCRWECLRMDCWAVTAAAWAVGWWIEVRRQKCHSLFPLVAVRSSSLDLGTSSFLVIRAVAGKGVRAYNVLFY